MICHNCFNYFTHFEGYHFTHKCVYNSEERMEPSN